MTGGRAAGAAAAFVLGLAGLAWLLRRRLAVVTIVGESMRPAFHPGDRVLVRRAGLADLRRGQVAVIERPGPAGEWVAPPPRWPGRSRHWMIKRVAALPGDELPGDVLPGGVRPGDDLAGGVRPGDDLAGGVRPGDALPGDELPGGVLADRAVVPPGKLVVLGDNAANSLDSRHFGCCPADRLLGVVLRPL